MKEWDSRQAMRSSPSFHPAAEGDPASEADLVI